MVTQVPYLTTVKFNQQVARDQEGRMNRLSHELTSGGEIADYRNLKNAKLFVDQETISTRLQQFVEGNKYNIQRLNTLGTNLLTLQDMASQLQQELSLVTSSSLVPPQTLVTTSTDLLAQVQQVLQANFNGEYIFSGSATSQMPTINLLAMPSPLTGSGPDFSYYLGNIDSLSFRASDNIVISSGITANQSGIEKLIRALRLSKDATISPPDLARIGQANDLCLQAIDEIISDVSIVNSSIKSLTDLNDLLLGQDGQLTESIKDLGYDSQVQTMEDYIQSKTMLELSRAVMMQLHNILQKFIDGMPR